MIKSYPKSCFHINENITRQRMAEYDRLEKIWQDKLLELFPNYYKMSFRERHALHVHDIVDKAVGFHLEPRL